MASAVEGVVNGIGYLFLGADQAELARDVFLLNTRLFPEASNTWDSLGEAHMELTRFSGRLEAWLFKPFDDTVFRI